ncbi:MAG: 4-hydroxy-3-methylbut-2-enyl diphosphate reductase [Candidatus Marinimicrobia bacterium]|nr:4-hydroxy-3-methylbut-2-enyl diphosphate reductase [Candidatus Neomarinimicrobiota bacterium]|tara:strand:+ start:641 stop:1483 length:843 start_codon:yes stop_codon:yes gene_type:complete
MKIIIAKNAGYCFGVRDAVDLANNIAEKEGEVYMLGDIVHNEKVVDDLSKAGAKVVKSLKDVPENGTVLFRAHGTKNDIWEEAQRLSLDIKDATCPLVHKIHQDVRNLSNEGRKIIVIGDHGHDEVVAIADQSKKTIVISNTQEAEKLKRIRKAGIVCQSTQAIENVQEIISILMTKIFDLRFVNTICYPTKRNQEQIKDLAKIVDIMIIIGSFTSANSMRLTSLSKDLNDNTFQVTDESELNEKWFANCNSVGISAGASTPDYLINNIKNKIERIGNRI